MSRKQKKFKFDPILMDEILNQPDVKELVAALEPDELKEFKLLLVRNGVYGRHVRRKQKAFIDNALNSHRKWKLN